MWEWLHRTAALYPITPSVEQQKQARRVLANLGGLVPCPDCRKHYDAYLERGGSLRAATANRESLGRWVEGLHNAVNAKLGRPTWSRLRSRLGRAGPRLFLVLMVSFLVAVALWSRSAG